MNKENALWSKVSRLEEARDSGGFGHAETTKKVILPTTKAVKFFDDGAYMVEGTFDIVLGEKYTVEFGGEKFEGVAVEMNEVSYVIDSGDKYSLLYFFGDAFNAVVVVLNSNEAIPEGDYAIAVYQQTETIHPIDPKFLPDGVGGGKCILPITEKLFGGTVDTNLVNFVAGSNGYDEYSRDIGLDDATVFSDVIAALNAEKTVTIATEAEGTAVLCLDATNHMLSEQGDATILFLGATIAMDAGEGFSVRSLQIMGMLYGGSWQITISGKKFA